MNKLLAFLLAVIMVFSLCACTSTSKLVGSWVCDEVHSGYPDQMVLNRDGTGVADGISCNWSTSGNRFVLSMLLGTYDYTFYTRGSTLYLDDYAYTKSR